MDTLEALVLGLIQGLTEYLPVSSSGHLAIGSAIFDVDPDKNMMFTVLVHVATVLSTLVVLGGQIWKILKGMFSAPAGGQGLAYFNEDQRYVLNIVVSMIPIGIVGLFFKKQVEANEGDIVVALVDNQNTLKRYFRDDENKKIILHPENKKMKDIIVDECCIQGVACHIIKEL